MSSMYFALRVRHTLASSIDAGVPVTATTYLGTTHDFVRVNQLADTPAACGAISQASDILKEHLWK